LFGEIALRRSELGEARAFALAIVGARPSGVVRRHFADWPRKDARGAPAAAALFAGELRARYLQLRSARFRRHRMLRITHGDPPVAGASPVSRRVANRCAAEPKDHHEQEAQAECSRGAVARRPPDQPCADGRRQERQISAARPDSPGRHDSSVFPVLRPRGSPPRLGRPAAAEARRRV
jgi:hypothetical protein